MKKNTGSAKSGSHILFCMVLTALTAVFALLTGFSGRKSRAEAVRVFLVPGNGLRVLSENPVAVTPGERAGFRVHVEDGYRYAETPSMTLTGDMLYVTASSDETFYPNLLKYCSLRAECDAGGSVSCSADALWEGEEAVVSLYPAEHFAVTEVTVNGTPRPVPADLLLRFTVQDDSLVHVSFGGEPLSFMALHNKSGRCDDYVR